jgi:hypothetical protein
MAKERSRYGEDDDSYAYTGTCGECAAPDPQSRTRHHLELVRRIDLDYLRNHLTEQYVKLREPTKRRPDVVDDICYWAATLMEQFSGMVEPRTGAPLSWWEARQYMAAQKESMAISAYAQAPAKYREDGTVKGTVVQPKTTREPGEEDMDNWPDEEPIAQVDIDPELLREDI